MQFDEYKNKGLSGLTNLGNTCFINSCMQILSHTYEINNLLNKDSYKKRLNNNYDSALLIEWDNLRKLMWKENCIISPGKFIQTIHKLATIKKNTQFVGFQQNDLPEFLHFVIDCFHLSLKREVSMRITGKEENDMDSLARECYLMIQKMYTKDYSEIWNMFYGIHVSYIECIETHDVLTRTPEPFFMINLPIPENIKEPTINDCFNNYVAGEKLTGENAWLNDKTGKKEEVIKKIKYWSLPSILCLDFKRFDYRGRKNQKLVTFPLENLDMSEYIVGYKKNEYIYSLYGVGFHSGGTMGGHYTAAAKNANGKWYLFNDTQVTEITDLERTIITPKAYCLFYRKKNM